MKTFDFPKSDVRRRTGASKHLSIGLLGVCLFLGATTSATEDDLTLHPAWKKCAGPNIARGKTVAGIGKFFTTPDGRFFPTVDYSTLTEGNFFPTDRWWSNGPIWWEEETDGGFRNILRNYLGHTYRVRTVVVQVNSDTGDEYTIKWLDKRSGEQSVTVPASDGEYLSPPTAVGVDTLTDSFDIVVFGGDQNYAVTEFQAFEPPLHTILGGLETPTS